MEYFYWKNKFFKEFNKIEYLEFLKNLNNKINYKGDFKIELSDTNSGSIYITKTIKNKQKKLKFILKIRISNHSLRDTKQYYLGNEYCFKLSKYNEYKGFIKCFDIVEKNLNKVDFLKINKYLKDFEIFNNFNLENFNYYTKNVNMKTLTELQNNSRKIINILYFLSSKINNF